MTEILVGVDGSAGTEDALALLDRLAAGLDGGDVARHAIADPSPPHALHQLAEETGSALVVVGSTHRGIVGRVLPGSTGERLMHGSSCPVAIVPRGYAAREDAAVRVVGVGHDGSDESDAALASACKAARRFGAALRVIRVFDVTRRDRRHDVGRGPRLRVQGARGDAARRP